MSLPGVVHNGVVVLELEMKLPEGTKVAITPLGLGTEYLRKDTESDPNFERAIAAVAAAEAKEHDPLEGEPVDLAKDSPAREEFRRILRGG